MNITGTDPISVIGSFNQATDGLLFITLLSIIWIIIYMKNKDEPLREAVGGASFITSIIAFLFAVLGWIDGRTFMITFIILAGSLVLLINKPRA